MPIFTAIAAFAATVSWASVAAFAARTLLTIGISNLLSNRANASNGAQPAGTQDAGGRVQLPPATNNKLVVLYGTAFLAPTVVDAMISTDQSTMWYVCALAEVPDSPCTISFDKLYWDGKLVGFDGVDPTKVLALTTNSDPAQIDTTVAGNINIYAYTNGSNSGFNTSLTAIQVLQDAAIPVNMRWTATDLMSHCSFMIVKIKYNTTAGTTGLPQLSVKLTNNLVAPGFVIYDYMTSTRYGAGINPANIDTDSLTVLNAYSDELIHYIPVGGTLPTATTYRYSINGPVNTGVDCLTNLQQLVDACDSWLQFSELTGRWKVVVNKSYLPELAITDLYHVTDDVLIGGIEVNPVDLSSTYNSMEVQYPNTNIKDQTDFQVVDLAVVYPALLNPNEPANQLTIQYPQVNAAVQAKYLGLRRLLQNREDLIITFNLDYSGIQVSAGDVIRVTFAVYGWNAPDHPYGKLFRVSQVQEIKMEDGTLGARLVAFEYNETVYADNSIQDFVPEANMGVTSPLVIGPTGIPVVSANAPTTTSNVRTFTVTSTVPTTGIVISVDFNYGTTNVVSTHKLYRTVANADGKPLPPGATLSLTVGDLPPGTYYWSTTARNGTEQSASNPLASLTPLLWAGAGLLAYNYLTGEGGVNSADLAPNAAGYRRLVIYNMRRAPDGVAQLVTDTTDRNIPLTYPGNTIAESDVFPWATGTGTITDGFGENSTGPYLPNSNSLQSIASEGLFGWYILVGADLTTNPVDPDETMTETMSFNFTTDTPNTIFQIVSFTIQTAHGVIGPVNINTEELASYDTGSIIEPNPYHVAINWSGNGAGSIIKTGYMIRNMTPGSNLTAIMGNYSLIQSKGLNLQ
jgi:hypothetical protein